MQDAQIKPFLCSKEKPKTRVCVIPGVGFHDKEPASFLASLRTQLPFCEISFYNWVYAYTPPVIPYPQSSFTKAARKALTEVILDAEWVLLHSLTMPVPEADIYIGHSAGSIVSLLHGNAKLIITMGNPAALIEGLATSALSTKMDFFDAEGDRKILNIVNEKDIVASPFNHTSVTNWMYTYGFRLEMPVLGPHSDYWTNKKVMEKIVATVTDYVVGS